MSASGTYFAEILAYRGKDTGHKDFYPGPGLKKFVKRAINKAQRCHVRSTGDLEGTGHRERSTHHLSAPEKFVPELRIEPYFNPVVISDADFLDNQEFEDFTSMCLPDWAVGVNFEEVQSLRGRSLGHGPDIDEEE